MFSLSSNLANCNNREPEPQAGSYTLRTSAFPMVTMRAKRLARFPGIAGIHGHQELVSVAEHVYLVVGIVAFQVKAAYLVEDFAEHFVALHNSCAQI